MWRAELSCGCRVVCDNTIRGCTREALTGKINGFCRDHGTHPQASAKTWQATSIQGRGDIDYIFCIEKEK